MLIYRQCSHITSLVLLSLLIPLTLPMATSTRTVRQSAAGQDRTEKNKDSSQKDDKFELSKREQEYHKIKKFSLDVYLKDAEFRDAVEDAYLQMQPEHSEYAYYINRAIRPVSRLHGTATN